MKELKDHEEKQMIIETNESFITKYEFDKFVILAHKAESKSENINDPYINVDAVIDFTVLWKEDGQTIFKGTVRYDGCSNWHFERCLHLCGKKDMGNLMEFIYDLAEKYIIID